MKTVLLPFEFYIHFKKDKMCSKTFNETGILNPDPVYQISNRFVCFRSYYHCFVTVNVFTSLLSGPEYTSPPRLFNFSIMHTRASLLQPPAPPR